MTVILPVARKRGFSVEHMVKSSSTITKPNDEATEGDFPHDFSLARLSRPVRRDIWTLRIVTIWLHSIKKESNDKLL